MQIQVMLEQVRCCYRKMIVILTDQSFYTVNLNQFPLNYPFIEKETLSRFGLFQTYLDSGCVSLLVYMDHSPITFFAYIA